MISSIDPDEQILYVQAEGFAPRYCRMSELLLETPSAFADVVLDPAPTVSGFIWDELGQIVAHATVTSFPVARSMEDAEFTTLLVALWPRTQTDEQGHYRLTGLPIGEVHINVQFPNQQRMAPTDVTLSPGDSAEVNFGNQGGFVVSGIVVEGADGMQDVDVQLGPLDPNAKSHFGRTDAAGRFKLIGVPPGQYVFAALRPREATNGQAQDPNDLTHVLYEVMEIQADLDLTVDYQTRSIHKQSPFP